MVGGIGIGDWVLGIGYWGVLVLSSGDWAQMVGDLVEVRGDREEDVVIRRGDVELAAQAVRVARAGGGGRVLGSGTAEESRGRVVVLGSVSFDVQPGDRFNDGEGTLYRVVLVRPNRGVGVVAEAEVVE